MSRARRALRFGFLVTALVVLTHDPCAAQGYRPVPYPSRRIRCESESHHHTYCRTYATGRVELARRLSKAPCREYYTWGADHDGGGLWVSDGCRALFVVLPWSPPSYGYGPPPWQEYRVTCESDRFKARYCPLPRWGQVQLERRLSDAPCRQYDTWGVDGGGIWVDRGCAAIFSVR